MNNNFSQEDKDFLALYSDSEYEKPSVTVDAVIFRLHTKQVDNYRKLPEKKLQVYLTKRNFSPYKNYFGVVGTFIDLKNELTNTMEMCVKNKVKLENFYSEQLFTFGDKKRDPRARIISISYMLLTDENSNIQNGEWFDVDISTQTEKQSKKDGYVINQQVKLTLSNNNHKLENMLDINIEKTGLKQIKNIDVSKSELAFDHANLIYYAIERLRGKLEYTDIIFNLLPETFTLTELKQSYEVILDQKLLDANFRRKIAKMVVATDTFETGRGHRSSLLYKHNPTANFLNIE